MKQRLPIGIQDFVSIRQDGFCYVDKTALIHRLITGSGKAFFLSRPRRFGKSLLCSTLDAVFQGKRELFGELAGQPALAIHSLEWEWKKHPVIRLDLNPGNYTNGIALLHENLNRNMEICAEKYGVPLEGETVGDRFARLIYTLQKQYSQRVAVIIDEYDKPLLSTIDNPDLHVKMRDELKGFYGILKSYDEYLQFVFLTGVTKFSHVSIFSDLNHLADLTLDPNYADLCGITQKEVEENFDSEITEICENIGKNRDEYLEELRRFYNGYRFSKKPLTVYNPFGLLNHFYKSGEFLPYWYETGTPTFLIKLIIEQKINILGLQDMHVRYEDFSKYDIETLKAEPLLYQSGYVTIRDYDAELEQFILDYPNKEVESSFSRALLEQYTQSSDEQSRSLYTQLPTALIKGEPEKALEALRIYFASIPYDLIQKRENYYQTAIHLLFSMLGLNCRSEVRIAAGRIDTLVETKKYVYCLEFKLDGSAEEALAQIDTKEYLLPWAGSGKDLFKIGVNFDHTKRSIENWKIKEQRAGNR
ncbi:MAG: ATP-binding protein [Spirochaetaceae bacterium]|jgi:hypothetical protein|nr:ATP-binding protein [Spirochaetaceae bacterium]